MAGSPYLFCEEKYWQIDKKDRPWDIFLPCMNNYNEKEKFDKDCVVDDGREHVRMAP